MHSYTLNYSVSRGIVRWPESSQDSSADEALLLLLLERMLFWCRLSCSQIRLKIDPNATFKLQMTSSLPMQHNRIRNTQPCSIQMDTFAFIILSIGGGSMVSSFHDIHSAPPHKPLSKCLWLSVEYSQTLLPAYAQFPYQSRYFWTRSVDTFLRGGETSRF